MVPVLISSVPRSPLRRAKALQFRLPVYIPLTRTPFACMLMQAVSKEQLLLNSAVLHPNSPARAAGISAAADAMANKTKDTFSKVCVLACNVLTESGDGEEGGQAQRHQHPLC